jgi:large subunit ribosomal protein L32
VAVPKRKMSRSNTRSRRAQWKAKLPQLNRQVVAGRTVWSVSHRARIVEDSAGTALFREYNGRRVTDV